MPILNNLSFFRRRKISPPAPPAVARDNPAEPPQLTSLKTLVIVYDPSMDKTSGKKLSEYMNWNRVEDLAKGFMSDILEASGGLARYQIVQRIDVDGFPQKVDGFHYDAQTYLNVVRGVTPPYMPQEADYYEIIDRFEILQRVARNEIDEVWIFNFPHAGFYESVMGGPGAFWCNAPPLKNTDAAQRRFVIMGFSYERGVGEMLEKLGHRAESIMEKTFEGLTGDDKVVERADLLHLAGKPKRRQMEPKIGRSRRPSFTRVKEPPQMAVSSTIRTTARAPSRSCAPSNARRICSDACTISRSCRTMCRPCRRRCPAAPGRRAQAARIAYGPSKRSRGILKRSAGVSMADTWPRFPP